MGKNYIETGDYAIREIEEEDLPQLLAWRNSPEIHSKMLTDHIITWTEHLAWFRKIKEQKPVLNFAFTYQGRLAGYTGCTKYDEQKRTCDPGNYLGTDIHLPIDAGMYIGEMFFEYAFMTLGITQMVTEVFMDNSRVVKLNQMVGYRLIGTEMVRKNNAMKKVAIMALDARDWKKRRGM